MDDKTLIMIFDGIGDRPVEELGGKTPLQAADTPNLDRAAEDGINGMMDTISPGIVPGSDTGHLALLGYDPYEVYTGRGPFEAAGIGLEVKPGEVAFRCNFATLDNDKVIDRRAGRINEDTEKLARSLNEMELGIDFLFKEAVEHRGVLIFKEKELGAHVSDVDPHEIGVPYHHSEASIESKEDRRTAELLNRFTEKSIGILEEHPVNDKRRDEGEPPANIILSRGAGTVPHLEAIPERTGLKSAAIAGIPLVSGVCKLAGMDTIDVEGATGGVDTDIQAIYDSIKQNLTGYDLMLVNIKGPDLLGHDGLAEEKTGFIEKMDEGLDAVLDLDDLHCVFTGDHSTPISVKNHSGDPLPITIYSPGVRRDDVHSYNEISCAKGGLGRIRGKDLLNIMLDLTNNAEKFGA